MVENVILKAKFGTWMLVVGFCCCISVWFGTKVDCIVLLIGDSFSPSAGELVGEEIVAGYVCKEEI